MTPIRRILVPTDFSAPAEAALKYARMLAGRFESRIHLLHVVGLPYLYDAWGTETVALRMADLLAQQEELARKQLQALAPRSSVRSKELVLATAAGVTVDEILNYIATNKIDLVVMGTHGRGRVGHLLLGSVAERLVQRSPVPVVTVHGTAAAAKRKRTPRP